MNSLRRHYLLRAAAFILALTTFGSAAAAQAAPNEAQVKAAFVYNFLKFVEWPDSAFRTPQDSLVIGIVGTGPTAEAGALLLAAKQVHGRAIAIRRLKDNTPYTDVHALFFGTGDSVHVRLMLNALSDVPVLSIGERAGFARGGGVIELLVDDQKIRFEINTSVAENAGLRVSSKLLALATVVHDARSATGAPK